MNHIKRDCGCETQHNGDGQWFIEFCPLHAAAQELLEALEVVNAWFWSEPLDTTKWPAEQINAAITHAEGK